jgi:hypothetical protein
MSIRYIRILCSSFLLFTSVSVISYSQEKALQSQSRSYVIDSLKRSGIIMNENRSKPVIILDRNQAAGYLQERIHPKFWVNVNDPLRHAFTQLLYEATHLSTDSLKKIVNSFPYDSLSIPWDKFYIWEPLRLKIPVIKPSTFSVPGEKSDSLTAMKTADSLKIKSEVSQLNVAQKTGASLVDTTILVVLDTIQEVTPAFSKSPIKYFNYPYQSDSLKVAVESLIRFLDERDSSVISFTGVNGATTRMMINSKSPKVVRYWLKNEFADSVTIWIENPSRDTIGLYLEQGVAFRRPGRQSNYANAKIDTKPVDKTQLRDLKNVTLKTLYWKYRTEASFVLNQAALSNWVKGGENSISTALDITEYADYNNKALKVSSNNFARIKFGYLASGKQIMKNLDLVETNSKLNHKAFGKFDFSAILLFKTQLARGYNYPNDSVPVSKFLNPAILTIGFGLDYKPNKSTSINFSPLSYKGTFVPSKSIDQTKYGIAAGKRSLNEPGVSLQVTNEFKPVSSIVVQNRLQLFTNYIHNPQNVDVDWEMIATAKLNWFTDVRLNTHLIFDDDTKTVELDKNKKPVLRPDGTEKRTARIQFKEMIGLSLSFRF